VHSSFFAALQDTHLRRRIDIAAREEIAHEHGAANAGGETLGVLELRSLGGLGAFTRLV